MVHEVHSHRWAPATTIISRTFSSQQKLHPIKYKPPIPPIPYTLATAILYFNYEHDHSRSHM